MQSGTLETRYMEVRFIRGRTNMGVNINLNNIKRRCGLFFYTLFFGGITWGFYLASVPDITDLIESRSIVYFFLGIILSVIDVSGRLLFGFSYGLRSLYKKHAAT